MTYPREARFTDGLVDRLPLLPTGQKLIRDTAQPGLYLRIGKSAKSWVVQSDLWVTGTDMKPKSKTVRRAIGAFPDMGAKEARTAAKKALAAILEEGGKSKPKGGPTLATAWARYRDDHLRRRNASPATIRGYDVNITSPKLLASWADVPLMKLAEDPETVKCRHEEITAASGPYAANGAMRTLRAIYGWARKYIDRTLPVDGPTVLVIYNAEQRRDTGIGPAELPFWWQQYRAMGNRVRAEFQLFLLLSGSRTGAVATARWEHLDMKRRVLHIPNPKGGAAKAFDIPLSRPMLACLARARRAARIRQPILAQQWIFPGDLSKDNTGTAEGHMSIYSTREKSLCASGNDLRQTYRTICAILEIPETYSRRLMNHALNRGDVHDGYITGAALEEKLRETQERVSRYIVDTAAEAGS